MYSGLGTVAGRRCRTHWTLPAALSRPGRLPPSFGQRTHHTGSFFPLKYRSHLAPGLSLSDTHHSCPSPVLKVIIQLLPDTHRLRSCPAMAMATIDSLPDKVLAKIIWATKPYLSDLLCYERVSKKWRKLLRTAFDEDQDRIKPFFASIKEAHVVVKEMDKDSRQITLDLFTVPRIFSFEISYIVPDASVVYGLKRMTESESSAQFAAEAASPAQVECHEAMVNFTVGGFFTAVVKRAPRLHTVHIELAQPVRVVKLPSCRHTPARSEVMPLIDMNNISDLLESCTLKSYQLYIYVLDARRPLRPAQMEPAVTIAKDYTNTAIRMLSCHVGTLCHLGLGITGHENAIIIRAACLEDFGALRTLRMEVTGTRLIDKCVCLWAHKLKFRRHNNHNNTDGSGSTAEECLPWLQKITLSTGCSSRIDREWGGNYGGRLLPTARDYTALQELRQVCNECDIVLECPDLC